MKILLLLITLMSVGTVHADSALTPPSISMSVESSYPTPPICTASQKLRYVNHGWTCIARPAVASSATQYDGFFGAFYDESASPAPALYDMGTNNGPTTVRYLFDNCTMLLHEDVFPVYQMEIFFCPKKVTAK